MDNNYTPENQSVTAVAEPVAAGSPADAPAAAESSVPTAATAPTTPTTPTTPAASVRVSFPAWYDYIVLALLFAVSQLLIGFVAVKCGYTPEIARQVADVRAAEGHLSTTTLGIVARATAIGYMAGMSAMVFMALAYRRLRGGRGRVARFSPRGFDPALLLRGFIVLLAASIVAEPLIELIPGSPDYENMLGRGGWALLSTVICAPIFEEFIFRGIILESVRRRRGVIAAWLLSSLCFGLAHGLPSQMVGAGVIGLVLGYVYIRSGSLFSGILLHGLNNALAMLLLILGFGDSSLREVAGPKTYAVIYIVSALIFVWWLSDALRAVIRIRRSERAAEHSL